MSTVKLPRFPSLGAENERLPSPETTTKSALERFTLLELPVLLLLPLPISIVRFAAVLIAPSLNSILERAIVVQPSSVLVMKLEPL